jgi:acyl dehydratase
MPSLYYEDWEVGKVYETARRTVTQRDVDLFGDVEGHKSPLHLDEGYATENSVFGKLTVHGLLTVAMAAGMMGDMDLFEGTALAFLELGWKFHAPVVVGDELQVRWWVSEKRPTSKPERGVITRSIEVVNQEGTTVCSGTMTTLWSTRLAAQPVA